jgi:type VI secretion system secreted protein VgrG
MATKPVDSHRALKFISPLGHDLLCYALDAQEELGRLFEYQLELLSTNLDIRFDDIVGQRVTVSLEVKDGERYFDGFVTDFSYTSTHGHYAAYQATVRPWLWFLTRTADCRIFQNQTVPDIIKAVFRDSGMSDFDVRLSDSYRKWVYCVQYRETDFNFVSRLMEQEGIYYFFEHEKGKHKLILADGIGAHDTFPGYETVPFYPPTEGANIRERDHLQYWRLRQTIMPGKYAVRDFDFEKPKVDLTARLSKTRPHAYAISDHEIYDYPGEYSEVRDGDHYVERKLQELQAQHERATASGTAMGLSAGRLFTLDNYPRKDQNKQYLIVSVTHDIKSDEFETGPTGGEEIHYYCHVEVMDKSEPFRSERITNKPFVQGPQTAIVVGPEGEEIYCDEYARVKVQFHWDRYGKNNQNSSCWVRVSQAWAGKGWGGIHIPRIGQEVIVSFLEGDPDQPMITGRVYNAVNMPPYGLEDNKTQSGIKSRSSKGGTADNFNEIRMEDLKGEEELYIQAEKDENILVKNNKSENVGNNEDISIGNNRAESVGNNETLTVGKDRSRNVEKNETVTIGESRTHSVGKNETISIGNNQSVMIGENHSVDVGKVQTFTIGENRSLSVGKNHDISVGQNETRNVGKNLTITAGDTIVLKCGSASISMKKNGDIVISGKNLTMKASSKVNVKASSNVIIKGAKILQN